MDLTLKSTVYNTNSLFVLTTYHTLTMLPWWLGYACNTGDLGSLSGLGRSPGEGKGHPLQYSGLENSMDCIVHGVAKSRTQLSFFHFHFQNHLKTVTAAMKLKDTCSLEGKL